jgi:gliding motility-associated-like protein
MKKSLLLFVFVCFINLLPYSSVFGQTAQPTPNPQYLYYCLNETAVPLSATASGGGTLRWYTAATTGGFSTTAPTPPTSIAATGVNPLTYYVTQVISGVESSPRTPIYVYVDQRLDLFCKTITPSSILFDFANTGQSSYTYSYTIDGGAPITGTHNSPSNFTVSGLGEGQTVSFTLTPVGAKSCVVSETEICTTKCSPANIKTPDFSSVPTSYCLNEVTTNLPSSSEDSPPITGTWSPVAVNTATAGTNDYTFTPDPGSDPCALTKTLTVTVGPTVPDFVDFSICFGEPPPTLSSSSPNGITGTWMPPIIDNMNSAAYDFTPDSGQACSPTNKTIDITVIPSNTISSISWTVTEAFADNQIVTVTDPVGGDYIYQLDDGPFQVDPVFEMVSLGMHSITVKDVDGCSEFTKDNVLVIDYPRFFTPNNDGYNDSWNVFTLVGSSGSKIQIFDRYGKLLKEISPNSTGWDGTYNGQPLPATDYWFVVDYPEDGIIKKFRSHFSLKR